jgi:hypothetical protein
MNDILPFIHPVIGGLAVLGMLWLGSRGLLARQGGKTATAKRRWHAKWGNTILATMALAAVTGTSTVFFVRDDLDVAGTWHFIAGWTATTCMAAIAVATPRRFRKNDAVKQGHPIVGVVAMVVGVAVLLLGFELLP